MSLRALGVSQPNGHRAEELRQDLGAVLKAHRQAAAENPLINPVTQLALTISERLHRGTLDVAALEALIGTLTVEAFDDRAAALAAYVGECDPAANAARLRAVIERLAQDADGAPLPFDAFAARIERAALGLVVTAHPTFGISAALTDALAQLAAGRDPQGRPLDPPALEALRTRITTAAHRPDDDLSLAAEHGASIRAITHIQDALAQVYELVYDVAATLYPDDWTRLTPTLMTVASWVGYDLDGRADITWADSLRARMTVAVAQLERYRSRLAAAVAAMGAAAEAPAVRSTLDLIDARLALGATELVEEMGRLPADAGDPAQLTALAEQVQQGNARRLTDLAELLDLTQRAVQAVTAPEARRALLVLRAEMANYGVALAHTHVRLNATQLHNAIRPTIGMSGAPDDSAARRRYLAALNEQLDAVSPVTINYATLAAERTTAKRLFMVLAQVLKYVDATTPIRFLIAEADTPLTVLSAIYYARLFGVADKVDISPLFETDAALERGDKVIGELLANPHYRAYIRARGRLCLQTGFSDAGRYLGQPAANMAIERLRMKLARLLGAHDLDGVELVIFDTHGESIGRGAHPDSLIDRLAYLSPPASRALFADQGVVVKQEISFQGGDGYVFFSQPQLAFATVCRLLEAVFEPPADGDAHSDPYYTDSDDTLGFFLDVKDFNAALIDNPDYAALLSAFGPNMLYPTGSRMIKRQHEGSVQVDVTHPSQIRAIPHNGILQQLGYLANSVGGVGCALSKDVEGYQAMAAASPRFRRLMALVARAHALSSIDVLAAYLRLFDPGMWLRRAGCETDSAQRRRMRLLVRQLEQHGRHEKLDRVLRLLHRDRLDLERCLADIGVTAPAVGRDALDLIHGVRVALIMEVFLTAMRIPRFTSQPDVTIAEILGEVLHLDMERALTVLERAFPRDAGGVAALTVEAPASYRGGEDQGYAFEHEEIFAPLRRLYDGIRRVTTAVAYRCGAIG